MLYNDIRNKFAAVSVNISGGHFGKITNDRWIQILIYVYVNAKYTYIMQFKTWHNVGDLH